MPIVYLLSAICCRHWGGFRRTASHQRRCCKDPGLCGPCNGSICGYHLDCLYHCDDHRAHNAQLRGDVAIAMVGCHWWSGWSSRGRGRHGDRSGDGRCRLLCMPHRWSALRFSLVRSHWGIWSARARNWHAAISRDTFDIRRGYLGALRLICWAREAFTFGTACR
jgi:hypothetical protein